MLVVHVHSRSWAGMFYALLLFPSALHFNNFSQLSPLSFHPHRCHLISRMFGTRKLSSWHTRGKEISVVLAANDENSSACSTNCSFAASFSLCTNPELRRKAQPLGENRKNPLKCDKGYITSYHRDNTAKLRRDLPLCCCLLEFSHNDPQRVEVMHFFFLFQKKF